MTFDARVEKGRVREGYIASDPGELFGMFRVNWHGAKIAILASDGTDWPFALPMFEHVSVSLRHRTPTWDEMTTVKGWFWNEDETVIQYHPPKSQYVNYHSYCLHLWKPVGIDLPLPPMSTIGPTDLTSGHDGEKDGKFCDLRRVGFDCVMRRCTACPERRSETSDAER